MTAPSTAAAATVAAASDGSSSRAEGSNSKRMTAEHQFITIKVRNTYQLYNIPAVQECEDK